MNLSALPLARIFWGVFALESIAIGLLLLGVLFSFGSRRGPDGGLVGAWIILIPVVGLALVAALFVATTDVRVHFGCIAALVLPIMAPVITSPVLLVKHSIEERLQERMQDVDRRGGLLFPEAGQRRLAAAIVDRNLEEIKKALPEAGDLNRQYSQNLPYHLPLGHRETLLSFALEDADDSDGFAQAVQLLIQAGADPNIPPGKPLSKAIFRSKRATKILLEAGADLNAAYGSNGLVWWLALDQGEFGNPDLTLLELLLSHGADTANHSTDNWGPIQKAAGNERWSAVWLLAQHAPNGKDEIIGPERETVHARLAREVKALKDHGEPVPEAMSSALDKFERATR